MLHSIENNKLLTYAIADVKGEFNATFSYSGDKIIVEVSMLGYETRKDTLILFHQEKDELPFRHCSEILPSLGGRTDALHRCFLPQGRTPPRTRPRVVLFMSRY